MSQKEIQNSIYIKSTHKKEELTLINLKITQVETNKNSEEQNSEKENSKEQNSEEQNSEEENSKEQNSEVQNSEEQNSYDQNSEEQNSEEQNSEEQNSYEQNSYEQNSEEENSEEQNSEEQIIKRQIINNKIKLLYKDGNKLNKFFSGVIGDVNILTSELEFCKIKNVNEYNSLISCDDINNLNLIKSSITINYTFIPHELYELKVTNNYSITATYNKKFLVQTIDGNKWKELIQINIGDIIIMIDYDLIVFAEIVTSIIKVPQEIVYDIKLLVNNSYIANCFLLHDYM
jgi:flagellar biosynthesis GTPase FlhF